MQIESKSEEAIYILSKPEILKQLRNDSVRFLKKLAQQHELLKDILDIGLRPTAFQLRCSINLSSDLPALAIDTLVNLYEGFIDLLAFDELQTKDRSLEGFEMDSEQGEEVNKQEPQRREYRLLNHIHLSIVEKQPEETAIYYLGRLLGPLCYQRGQQLIGFYESKYQIMDSIIKGLHKRAAMQIFCKIIEIESGKQFFREYKARYLEEYLKIVIESLRKGSQQWLEGLLALFVFITEKMEEKQQYSKYLQTLEKISGSIQAVTSQLVRSFPSLSQSGKLTAFKWVEELLKHDSCVMGHPNVRLALTFMNRKNSISNNFYAEQRPEQRRPYHLKEQHLHLIVELVEIFDRNFLLTREDNPSNLLLFVAFYRLLYFLARIWKQLLKEKKLELPSEIEKLLNESMPQRALQVIGKYPKSTFLHNSIKEVIIECLRQGFLLPSYFFSNQCRYQQLLHVAYPRTPNTAKIPFSQQIFHIFKQVHSCGVELPSSIQQIMNEQVQRITKPIGGDPRKLHGDTLRGSSNAFSQSSENIDELIEFDLSQHNAGSNRSLGFSMKIANATSIEFGDLEERIVIEGVEDQQDD